MMEVWALCQNDSVTVKELYLRCNSVCGSSNTHALFGISSLGAPHCSASDRKQYERRS
jgi:hypothetical protein